MNKISYQSFLSTISIPAMFACMIACAGAKAADQDSTKSVFKYREVYLPEAIGENAEKLGLNTLDEDWGIWGHNLSKVVPEKHSESIFAKINGSTIKKQYCFSSNRLYEYIEDYIDRKYDDDERIRFAIMPNDNDLVCLCVKCVEAGNTRHDASPAVFNLIDKLSKRFPNHLFYTSDYRTTKSFPVDTMPVNTGTIVSAMPYPLSTYATPDEQKFIERLNEWGKNTHRILVWDYINNFDDYFTPYPVIGAMQRRLKNYHENKVTAIFLNGSGQDYSAMSDIKSHVLAEVSANPESDWKEILMAKAMELYPVTGQTIAEFMLEQEDFVNSKQTILPLYDGVENAVKTYLPEESFKNFHDKLLSMRDKTSGDERTALDTLLGQLAYTRLELKRMRGDLRGADALLNDMEYLLSQEIESYNEAGWSIESYLKDYRFLLNHEKKEGYLNKLKGERLVAMTPLDPDYSNISILSDGVLGIPSNYHSGNLITSPAQYTQIAVPNKPGLKKLKVWLVYNPAYRINLPEMVTLSSNGKELKSKAPEYPNDGSGHVALEFDVPSNLTGSLLLTFYKDPESHSMAIDEIEGY